MPLHLRVSLWATGMMFAVVAVLIILAQNNGLPSKPFSTYTNALPGQTRHALIESRFSCPMYYSVESSEFCTQSPPTGPFSLIAVTLSDGVVRKTTFAVREGALRVGDLPSHWGRPTVHVYGRSVKLDWSDIGVTAFGWSVSGEFSYFLHVSRLLFS
jgi:hypothetical protein